MKLQQKQATALEKKKTKPKSRFKTDNGSSFQLSYR
jgi:hypothetical protein